MSLYSINVHNASDFPFVFVTTAGESWTDLPPLESVVQPGKDAGSLFRIAVPGFFANHWGFLYFRFEIPGIGSKMFLIYTELSNSMSAVTCGAGPCNDTKSSTHNAPFPQGQFGMTSKDEGTNATTITLFNKDLLSTQLSPEFWMEDLARIRPSVLDWPLSRFKYPGQHDAGSFGNKQHSNYPTAWSWQCSDKNFYNQACSGIRWFDLRLCKTGAYFWPFHGYSEQTGDPLSWGTGDSSFSARPEDTLIGQMLQFIQEHPNEILMLHVNFKSRSPVDEGWLAIYKYMKDYLIPPPSDNKVPTLRSIRGQKQRIIMFSNHDRFMPQKYPWIMDYIWDAKNKDLWRGTVWNQQDWDKHDMSLVVRATENWMRENIEPASPHIFWWAQCQLTPSFMHPDFFLYPSRSPKALAKIANPYTREFITNRDLYKQNGSVLSLDWASSDENIAIAAMNLETDGSTGPWDEQAITSALPSTFRPASRQSEPFVVNSQTDAHACRTNFLPRPTRYMRVVRALRSPEKDIDTEYDEIDALKEKKKSLFRCW